MPRNENMAKKIAPTKITRFAGDVPSPDRINALPWLLRTSRNGSM